MVSFVWGDAEVDINVAGLKNSEGYYGLQFAGVGQNYEVLKKIRAMYKDEGQPEPKAMQVTVYYNRGVLAAALHARAIELAIRKHGPDISSQQVAEAMQTIQDFSLGGLIPPLTLSPRDHEGGGWVQMYQVQEGKWVPVTDWYKAYSELIDKMVYAQG
jgi:branched-chain amino acid transport system substrate-binding protein